MITLAEIAQLKPDAEECLRIALEDVAAELSPLPAGRLIMARLDAALRELALLRGFEIELLSSGKTATETETLPDALRHADAKNRHSDTQEPPTPSRGRPRGTGNSLSADSDNPHPIYQDLP